MLLKELVEKSLDKLNNNKVEDSRNKFFIIAKKVLELSKESILVHEDDEIEEAKCQELDLYIDKIIEGIPVQYLVNEQEFYGLKFYVNENVLIPQPDTEILVEEALKVIKDQDRVLDLCTGSGCIGITIAAKTNAKVTLSDISSDALEVAFKNSENLAEGKVLLVESNLFEDIKGTFNVIVSNPPYIKSEVIKALSQEVQNEPMLALDGGEDGLTFYRKIVEKAADFLDNNGYLILEIGYDQKEEVIALAKENSYKNIKSVKDLSNNDRVIIMQKGE